MKVLIVSLFRNEHIKGGIQAFLERFMNWQCDKSEITYEHLAISDRPMVGRGNFSVSTAIFNSLKKYDLIMFCGHNIPAIDYLFIRAKFMGIPIVLMPFFHGIRAKKRFGFSKLYFKIIRLFLYQFAQKIFFVSEEEAKTFCGRIIEKSKCELTSHALSQSILRKKISRTPKSSTLNVGYVGRPVNSKGFDLFCEIASCREYCIAFSAIGPQLTKGKNCSDVNVLCHFNDNINDDQILDFYMKCDVIIVPSREESFGLVVIEALALGCQVIASNNVPAATLCEAYNEITIVDQNFVANTVILLKGLSSKLKNDNFDLAQYETINRVRCAFNEDNVYSVYDRAMHGILNIKVKL